MEKPDPRLSWKRLDGVDLLRGLAIFLVLMNHVNMQLLFARVPYTRGLPEQLVSSLVWNGQFGVQIFFAVSGFLITSTTLRRWKTIGKVSLRGFYQLRLARIAPLLLLLLTVLSGLHLAHVKHFVVSQKTGGLPGALSAALTFHINLLEARKDYLPGNWDILWSLSVEEVFYLFFPLACVLFRRIRFLLIPLAIFVLLGPFARSKAFNPNPVWREYSYLGGMDAIALGCITALILSRRSLSRTTLKTLAICGAALVLFILCFSLQAYKLGLGRNGLDMSVIGIGTCMLITVAAQTHWRAPGILSPLKIIGQRSYEIYLTHEFIVIAFAAIFIQLGKSMKLVPVLFVAVIVVAACLGAFFAWIYSEPMNRRLRKLWHDGPTQLGSVVE
jgi:peptidoglycan/LPS O-acetylase OafA/YrhL